ncbi:MAG: triose-phosphate isomerase [Desulfobulbaceae bacterium]|nr:triose-phosphate isomerase [Desulfobulbaceae bacterium]
MDRTPLIAGNWKMYLSVAEAVQLASSLAEGCRDLADREVMLAPPYISLAAVASAVKGSIIQVAGQNVCWDKEGAFTGEISPVMLKEAGAAMVILGHSERRHIFAEDDKLVNRRLRGALVFGLSPILCVGETLDERERDATFTVLETQLTEGLKDVGHEDALNVVIAYEPVWAIGTGKTASNEQAQEAHKFIREVAGRLYEKKLADKIRILYGGSVKPENIDMLMAQPDIDGALVGGAALKFESFDRIIHFSL